MRIPKRPAFSRPNVVHDPRAPRLAATSTLGAAVVVLLTAVNLSLDIVGTAGFSVEEGLAIGVVGVLLVVAWLANRQAEVPTLATLQPRSDEETFESTVPLERTNLQGEVNPTTASILSSILGEQRSTSTAQVNSAIDTLSSGAFGDNVQRTMDAITIANQQNSIQINDDSVEEQAATTFKRVHVQPVPLPGREDKAVVDPATLPGLEPNRVFVTEGAPSVPLPDLPAMDAVLELPEMPDLDDLLSTTPAASTPSSSNAPHLPDLETAPQRMNTDPPELPDLDDLF